jgi:hypothetical protein
LLAGIATTVVAKNKKHAMIILAEPLGADVIVKRTITNSGKGRMSFQTCPNEVYSVELKDSHTRALEAASPVWMGSYSFFGRAGMLQMQTAKWSYFAHAGAYRKSLRAVGMRVS